MAVREGNQGPVFGENLFKLVEGLELDGLHALGAGELLLARLEEQRETVTAVRVTAWQHAWYTFLFVPFIETHVALHSVVLRFSSVFVG